MEIEDILNAMHTGLIREMHKRKTTREVNLTSQTHKRIQKVMEGLEEIELEILKCESEENSKYSQFD